MELWLVRNSSYLENIKDGISYKIGEKFGIGNGKRRSVERD
jgi:hypothetical protein